MAVRGTDVARALVGARALLGTRAQARADLGRAPTGAEVAVVRVLGARQVLQTVVVARTGWRALGAVVDLLHGASMVVLLAVAPRRYGRAALAQVLTAAALAAQGLRVPPRRG